MLQGRVVEFSVTASDYELPDTLDLPVTFYYSLDFYTVELNTTSSAILALKFTAFLISFMTTSILAWRVYKLTET